MRTVFHPLVLLFTLVWSSIGLADSSSFRAELWGACEEGNQIECQEWTKALNQGLGGPQSSWQAQKFLTKACKKDQGWACNDLGRMHTELQAKKPSDKKALALFESACGLEYMEGCANAAWMLYNAKGVDRLSEEEKRDFNADDRGDDDSLDTAVADNRRLVSLYRQACEGGHAPACDRLGDFFVEGDRVPATPRKAADFYAMACEQGFSESCLGLGRLLATGNGVKQNLREAGKLYVRACEGGFLQGCTALGDWFLANSITPKSSKQAMALYSTACDGGDMRGCFGMGQIYDKGMGRNENNERAARLYRNACDGKEAESCFNLGVLVASGSGVAKDLTAGAALFEQSCELGFAWACFQYAKLLETGKGVAQDLAAAFRFHDQACLGNEMPACVALGDAFAAGLGIEQSDVMAVRSYGKRVTETTSWHAIFWGSWCEKVAGLRRTPDEQPDSLGEPARGPYSKVV